MADKSKKKDGREASKGYALVAAPDGATSCSVAGEEYQADDQGVVEVKAEHVATLVALGFIAL